MAAEVAGAVTDEQATTTDRKLWSHQGRQPGFVEDSEVVNTCEFLPSSRPWTEEQIAMLLH